MRTIIKQLDSLILYKSSRLKYYKNNKANLHNEITYYMELDNEYVGPIYTSKTKAIKAFSEFSKVYDCKRPNNVIQLFPNKGA